MASEQFRRLGRAVLWTAAMLLLAFHAGLFLTHLADGRLLTPLVALRWGAAAGLFGLLLWQRRMRVPLTWGRRALVFWVIVFFLHASAHVPAGQAPVPPVTPDAAGLVLVVMPTVVTVTAVAGILVLTGALRRRGGVAMISLPVETSGALHSICCGSFAVPFVPRPPPRS